MISRGKAAANAVAELAIRGALTAALDAGARFGAGRIAVAAMVAIVFEIAAALGAEQGSFGAAAHAPEAATSHVAEKAAPAAVLRVGIQFHAALTTGAEPIGAVSAALPRSAGVAAFARIVAGTAVVARGSQIDADVAAKYLVAVANLFAGASAAGAIAGVRVSARAALRGARAAAAAGHGTGGRGIRGARVAGVVVRASAEPKRS
jgi:hypothetical protein